MSKKHFNGKVIRVEPDGFGMVEFENEIGSAKHGFFNANTINVGKLHATLIPGTQIEGDVALTKGDVLEVLELDLAESDLIVEEVEIIAESGSV